MTDDNLVKLAMQRAAINRTFNKVAGVVTEGQIEYDCQLFFFNKDNKKKMESDWHLYAAHLPILGRYFVVVSLSEKKQQAQSNPIGLTFHGFPISTISDGKENLTYSVHRFWSIKKAMRCYNALKEMYKLV
jgi:hypothetical protein